MKGNINDYAKELTPSIDISYADDGQLPKANEAKEVLRKLGFDVIVDDRPSKKISQNTYVRYFFNDDKGLARQIVEHVKPLGINAQLQSFAEEPDREIPRLHST